MSLKKYTDLFNDQDFKNAVLEKRLCLFLGAGVGINIEMPDWRKFSDKTVAFCFDNNLISLSQKRTINNFNDPLKSISLCTQLIKQDNSVLVKYENNVLKNLFYKTPYKEIKRILEKRKTKKTDKSIYNFLHEMHSRYGVLIVQTNYDVCLEMLADFAGKKSYLIPFKHDNAKSVIESYLDEKKSEETPFPIVYLHGRFFPETYDYSHKHVNSLNYNDLIIDREQYNQVYVLKNEEKYKNQSDFIKYLLSEFSIVFLGYSLTDYEIMQLIANRGECEDTSKISVIVDNCSITKLQNQLNSDYIYQASNQNISTYYYDVERKGVEKGFYSVIEKLYKFIKEANKNDLSLIVASDPLNIEDWSN